MASITSKKTIFFVTSPRTPIKMIEEINLLLDNYKGKAWNNETQSLFAKDLARADFFEGSISKTYPDFSARDRINRAPKALGLVNLDPVVNKTKAGELFLTSKRPNEIFTRQLLKFQLPSPYHPDKQGKFAVKPYLELFRLVKDLKTLGKDEIAIFAMQLVNYKNYDIVKEKIINFRNQVKNIDRSKTSYKRERDKIFEKELEKIFKDEITNQKIKTRESSISSLKKFIKTKKNNHLDYADAAIRYLRATELVSINLKTYGIYIPEEKENEVDFALSNIDRKPAIFPSKTEFKKYLFDDSVPKLALDDRVAIIDLIKNFEPKISADFLKQKTTEELKNIRDELSHEKRTRSIKQQVKKIRTYKEHGDIMRTFEDIENRNTVDPSLIMEWNTWRAFEMLDDGEIIGNFKIDDNGVPLSVALGNNPDILCRYKTFDLIVEVTLSTGQRQYEMEGEPVARHLGNQKKSTNKETYCIFIANSLNPATIAHFFMGHRTKIAYYGGISKIIPIRLSDFKLMLQKAKDSSQKPKAINIKGLLDDLSDLAVQSENEKIWQESISEKIENWI
ncbi:AlwI family type II restriction endonuclease [Patescibacteria group bacterium]|nr:AlwI family type II restriction endonuclease [Patescibacteria group bacterium]